MLVAIQNGFSQEIPFVLQGPAGLSAHGSILEFMISLAPMCDYKRSIQVVTSVSR
jgi:hypothetical protein